MSVSSKDSIHVLQRIGEKLARTMDLLVIHDKNKDFVMATACFDAVNWQVKEIQARDGASADWEVDPFIYNFWRSCLQKPATMQATPAKASIIILDRDCRKCIVAQWLSFRDGVSKKDFIKKTKSADILKMIIEILNNTYKLRNGLFEDLPALAERLATMNFKEKAVAMSVVTYKLPKCLEEYEKYKAPKERPELGKVKAVLREAARILSIIDVSSYSYDFHENEVFAAAYDKWIDQLFDLMEEMRHTVSGFPILSVSMLSYQYLKTYLKTYNVFERVQSVRPDGSYTEVKYSGFFQSLYLKWRVSQLLMKVFRRTNKMVKLDLEKASPPDLYVLIAQLFGWMIEESSEFVISFTVLRDFWAASDKIKYIKELSERQKDEIDLYNRVSLSMYRQPAINPVLEDSVSDEEEEPNVRKEARLKIDREIFEEVLKEIKLMDCSKFKLKFTSKKDLMEVEEKFKAFANKNRTRKMTGWFKEEGDKVYSGNRTENPTEGLTDILNYYIKEDDED